MKSTVLLVFALAGSAHAQPLTQGDRDYALSALHASSKFFVDTVANLTPKQWNCKPSPEVWSPAELAEHIAASEDLIFSMASVQVMKSPAQPELRAQQGTRAKDEMILKGVVNREKKFQAPEPLKPTNRYKTPEAAVAAFRNSRVKSLEYVRSTDADLRSHYGKHPAMGDIDALQWILLMAGHTERHTLQIREVMANPACAATR